VNPTSFIIFGIFAKMYLMTGKYFLYITGCDMNYSDAERIATILNGFGYSATNKADEADIVIAVACSVREKAVHKVLGKVNEWKKIKIPIILVTGCIIPQDKKKFEKKADLVFEIKDLKILKGFLNRIMDRELRIKNGDNQYDSRFKVQDSSLENVNNYLAINPSYKNKFSAYLPIMTGCNNFCSYCAVPYARGREISRSKEEILAEIKGLIDADYKEITLLGQNVNSYGGKNQESRIKVHDSKLEIINFKNNSEFVELLQKIDNLETDAWFRFYANHPKDFSDELIDFLKDSKHFCHYIHLPLQSGDDEILKKMNRHYTAEQYLKIIDKIKKKIPDCVLATDIIVGFPGESKEAFQNTVKTLEKVGFDMIFISEYSPRSGTVAAKMEDDVPHEEKERRKKYLNDEVLAKSLLQNNKKLIGKTIRVLVHKKSKAGMLAGRNYGLKDISFRGDENLIGKFVNIKITKAERWGMEGEI